MSSYTASRQSRRILPASVEAALARLFRRVLGIAVLSLALAGWVSLLTWSISDPSINHITETVPENLLGKPGAITADLLMQSLGLASIGVLLPVAALGFRLATGMFLGPLRLMTLIWLLAAALSATALSAVPAPETWPLVHGLGGIIGDFLLVALASVGGFAPEGAAKTVTGIVTGLASFWALLTASGLRLRDLAVLVRGAGRFTDWPERPGRNWGRRVRETVPKRASSGDEDTAGPQEFWMRRRAATARDTEINASSSGETQSMRWRRMRRIGRRADTATEAPKPEPAEQAPPEPEPSASERHEPAGDRVEPYFGSLAPKGKGETTDASQIWATHFEAHRHLDSGAPRTRQGATEPAQRRAASRRKKGGFTLPATSLLTAPPKGAVSDTLSDEELTERAEQLEGTLRDFGVKGEVTDVHPGPVITLYELRPARGTKSSRVIGLSDDIARSMGAVSARVSVIPGRDALGIELPNEKRETVYLRALLETSEYRDGQAKLPLALGKNISGAPVIVDLARMPHLLIAGTTGSGKSVGINAMILSLLYRLPPEQCRFLMIDPKMLELSVYDGIPHLLTPVVTDPKKAVVALKWTVAEMNRRYERMHKVSVRNIQGYNQRVAEARARGEVLGRTVNTGFDEFTGQPIYEHEDIDAEPMPYIVVVIDEMADLMMVAGKDIEFAVQRLSQMARAAGIHVIMATQRPSVDVITGTIKSNFPSRISFQVASKIDSRTILNEQGAEQLLGAGDMLHLAAGGRVIRVHGPFVGDAELEQVVRHLKQQGAPEYRADVLEAKDDPVDPRLGGSEKPGGADLFSEAVEIVKRDRRATTSYLQRRLGIGYNRAATLIERLEEEGVISPANRSGKREILIPES